MRSLVVILAVATLCVAPMAMAEGCGAPTAAAGEVGASAKPAFSKMDKNADGELTLVEIDGLIETYPELGLVREAFAVIDVDQNGVITVTEYEAWVPMSEEKAAEVME